MNRPAERRNADEFPAPAPEPTGVRGWLHRWATLLDGEMAEFPREYRERVVEWQERKTRFALIGVMRLFVAVALFKTMLVLAGVWPVASPAWAYVVLAVVMALAAHGYRRARGTAAEAAVAGVFMLALLLLAFDPAAFVRGEVQGAMGLLLLLPAIGIPLLVLLRSALVLAIACVLLCTWFLAHSGWDTSWKLAFGVNMAVAAWGGMMLRVFRANMSVGFIRSMEAAILQATTDSLTGLMNRQGWFKAAELALQQVREGGRVASLLFIDLDDFKKLNDTHGHAVGDEALRRTGQVLAARLNPGALAARIGGEEFVCLLPDQLPEQARRLAERLSAELKAGPMPVTFSAGVAEFQPGDGLSELMARADAAMYAAKERGRDRVF
ncbi:MAG TPA: GGDEF domain-containing protein [Thermomonas sp.]|nr:GGDEF domain-containing protein [Thermomonas sp.]